MKDFITRTITAFFLIIAAYALIRFVPPLYFSIVLFLLICGAAYEFLKLTGPVHHSKIVIFLSGLMVAAAFTFRKPGLTGTIIFTVVLTGLYFLLSIRKKEDKTGLENFVRDMGIHLLIIGYLFIPLYFLFRLKQIGANYLFFLIFVIAIGDSAAYFFGKAFGKHKIYPVASPNKSLEGLIAAVIFAGVSGWLALLIFPVPLHPQWWLGAASGAITGLFSQLSDPVESLFKRSAGKKDSGSILPGHGGILDRIDSYIFCGPLLYYIIVYLWK